MTTTISRPGGRVAYDVTGEGPLVVLVPGMGDLRSTYRELAPALAAAGHRVAVTDLRGHGDSDATFDRYGDAATGSDVLALIEELGGPAVVVGNSMGAGAAVWAAAERPDLVRGLALLGPFVRDPRASRAQLLLFRLLMARPWAAAAWNAYLPKLYAGRRPADLARHRAAIRQALRRPGHAAAFAATTRISHAEAEARLDDVHTPTLVVMGELDPDFPEPAAEARWIAGRLGADTLLVPEAGHYPHAQRPDLVTPAVLELLAKAGPTLTA